MKKFLLLLLTFAVLSLDISAQQVTSQPALSSQQREGRQIFQRKCAVCHVPASSIAEPYGPKLSKALVEGNESDVRQLIMNGSDPQMPGWKYTLQPDQINNVIEYLKTLEIPGPTVASERPES